MHNEALARQAESGPGVPPATMGLVPTPSLLGRLYPQALSGWQVSGCSIEDSENVLGELSCRQVLGVKFTLNLLISGRRDGQGVTKEGRGAGRPQAARISGLPISRSAFSQLKGVTSNTKKGTKKGKNPSS